MGGSLEDWLVVLNNFVQRGLRFHHVGRTCFRRSSPRLTGVIAGRPGMAGVGGVFERQRAPMSGSGTGRTFQGRGAWTWFAARPRRSTRIQPLPVSGGGSGGSEPLAGLVNGRAIKLADFGGRKWFTEDRYAVLPFGFAYDGQALDIAQFSLARGGIGANGRLVARRCLWEGPGNAPQMDTDGHGFGGKAAALNS
jgi:hypothetical protein